MHARAPLLDVTPIVMHDMRRKNKVMAKEILYTAMYPVSFMQFPSATVRSMQVALKSRKADCKLRCMFGANMDAMKDNEISSRRQ